MPSPFVARPTSGRVRFPGGFLHAVAGRSLVPLALVVAGLALLVTGARWMVDGAAAFAVAVGLSELIVGLTVVAVGTSLPEIATSLTASLRGERDIAVGNAIGSCIFNILVVVGLTATLAPNGLDVPDAILGFDIPVMVLAAVACLPIAFTGHRIARWEGLLFLVYYVAYVLYLVLDATEHDALPLYNLTIIAFALPLTIATLFVLAAEEAVRRRKWRRVVSRDLRHR